MFSTSELVRDADPNWDSSRKLSTVCLQEEALAFQSTGIFVPVFTEKIFICLGWLITDALRYSVRYVVENIRSILQQLVGKRVHVFKHFGGFKFLANVLH